MRPSLILPPQTGVAWEIMHGQRGPVLAPGSWFCSKVEGGSWAGPVGLPEQLSRSRLRVCAWLCAGASAEASAAGRGSSRGREQPWLRLIPVSFGRTGSRRRLLRGDLFPPTCSGRAVRHGAVSPGAAHVSPGILCCRRCSSEPMSRRGGDGKEEAKRSQ